MSTTARTGPLGNLSATMLCALPVNMITRDPATPEAVNTLDVLG